MERALLTSGEVDEFQYYFSIVLKWVGESGLLLQVDV
jgi:hypothetical protein